MKEYKREKGQLDSQLKDLQKRSMYHDDHIRIIDAWFSQVGQVWLVFYRHLLTELIAHSLSMR